MYPLQPFFNITYNVIGLSNGITIYIPEKIGCLPQKRLLKPNYVVRNAQKRCRMNE